MNYILVLAEVYKPQRIYNSLLEIARENVSHIPNIYTNFTMLIYFIMTCNLIISTKSIALLLYYYRPAN